MALSDSKLFDLLRSAVLTQAAPVPVSNTVLEGRNNTDRDGSQELSSSSQSASGEIAKPKLSYPPLDSQEAQAFSREVGKPNFGIKGLAEADKQAITPIAHRWAQQRAMYLAEHGGQIGQLGQVEWNYTPNPVTAQELASKMNDDVKAAPWRFKAPTKVPTPYEPSFVEQMKHLTDAAYSDANAKTFLANKWVHHEDWLSNQKKRAAGSSSRGLAMEYPKAELALSPIDTTAIVKAAQDVDVGSNKIIAPLMTLKDLARLF